MTQMNFMLHGRILTLRRLHLDKVYYTVVVAGGGYSCYQSVQIPPPSLLTVILAVVLYGLEISSLTLSEECRLTVFKNRVLKKIWA